MSTIVAITHSYDKLSSFRVWPWGRQGNYMLFDILQELKRRGHRIVVTQGVPDRPPVGDAAILHVNATVTPPEYVAYARSFPCCLNLGAADISKRRISGARLDRGDDWPGPVIVKSNLNYRGVPEVRLNRIAQSRGHEPPFPGAKVTAEYAIYENVRALPEGVFDDAGLIVDRFIPERENELYAARFWVFCGNQERCNRYVSPDRILKGSSVVRHEPAAVPEDLRALRSRLGFDYGKFDFVVHDGKAVLLDANKTPGRARHLGDKLKQEIVKFADGFEWQMQAASQGGA